VLPFARARGFLAAHRACEEVGSGSGNRVHWRARPCTATVPEVTASHAAVGVRRRSQQPQQALRLLPASWRLASAPEGVACGVATRLCPEGPVAAGELRRRAVALEAGLRRVGTCLPARHRRCPGWAPAASCRFADAGSYHGRSLLVAGRAPGLPALRAAVRMRAQGLMVAGLAASGCEAVPPPSSGGCWSLDCPRRSWTCAGSTSRFALPAHLAVPCRHAGGVVCGAAFQQVRRRAGGSSVSVSCAGLPSFANDAAHGFCAGCGELRRVHRRGQKFWRSQQ